MVAVFCVVPVRAAVLEPVASELLPFEVPATVPEPFVPVLSVVPLPPMVSLPPVVSPGLEPFPVEGSSFTATVTFVDAEAR